MFTDFISFLIFYNGPSFPEAAGLIEVNQHFENTVVAPSRWQQLANLTSVLPDTLYPSSIYGIVSSITNIHRSRNSGVKMRVPLLTITSSDLLAKC
jgi:hypothetical protein